MSKLSKLITAKLTDNRATITSSPYNISMVRDINYVPSEYYTQIKFTAEFGCAYYLQEQDKNGIATALSNVKKSVIEEVFGEFRAPLRELGHLIYLGEDNAALEALRKIEISMFNE